MLNVYKRHNKALLGPFLGIVTDPMNKWYTLVYYSDENGMIFGRASNLVLVK